MIKISIIIPLYNEEENLQEMYSRLTSVLTKRGSSYEIIFVDDGSTDKSSERLLAFNEKDTHVKVIQLSRNFGQPAAIAAGLGLSDAEYTLVLDADLQNPPEEIPKLLDEIESKDYDIVYGIRKNRKDTFFRRFSSNFLYWYMTKVFHIKLPRGISAFRVMNRNMVDFFNHLPEKTRLYGALSSWKTNNYKCIEVSHSTRFKGKSKYSFFKLFKRTTDLAIAFSLLPLRWIGFSGIMVALGSIGCAFYYLIQRLLYGFVIPGYTSIIVSLMFFSGVQLISLSIIGEYIGRIYTQVQDRPMFIIDRLVGFSLEQNKGASD
ncbi:MAG: glycosyltransferase family 2 protein [bacterium]|nr:glycosyltransferase family 2 protein [bacterium]MBU1918033.1 glycosyltransferase family 2 protein [bacterium]